ncbi:MAG: efflux RND transporter periplasmic adaptor subunit [Opitutaceae bacterium]
MSGNRRSLLWPKILVVLAVVAGAAVFGLRWMRPVVTVDAAWIDTAVDAIPGTVTVRSKQETEIKSEVGGRVVESRLEIGDRVAAGDLLVQIDSADVEIEIERLKAEIQGIKRQIEIGSQIRYDLIDAKERLEGAERNFARGSLSEAELAKQQRVVQQIEDRIALEELRNEQQLAATDNALKTRERQLEKMSVYAPIDCIIADVFAYPGDLIGGGAPIARIISPVKLVEARISQEDMAGLSIGQKASVRLIGEGSKVYDAKVVKILPVADAETQRYIINLEVDVDPDRLVPGVTGEASIVIARRENAVIIPRRALIGKEVYVVKDGVIDVRTVEPGFVSLNKVEIRSGLSEGESVVTEDFDRLQDGDRVRIGNR